MRISRFLSVRAAESSDKTPVTVKMKQIIQAVPILNKTFPNNNYCNLVKTIEFPSTKAQELKK